MIEIYTGAVGSGKSYHALCVALEYLSYGKFVVANFPIKLKKKKEKKNFLYLENDEITVERLIRLSFEYRCFGREGSALLLLDEAGVLFNSRDWNLSRDRKDWVKFFSQSRKFGYDVIMVAQSERMIDRQIRSMAEFEVKHVKLNSYPWLKCLPFTIFAYVKYWKGGSFRGSFQPVILLPWVAKRYDTMKLFSFDEIPAEYLQLAQGEKKQEAGEGGQGGPPSPAPAPEPSATA